MLVSIYQDFLENEYFEVEYDFVWSGQHYSDNMKDTFFRQLNVPIPDFEFTVDEAAVLDFHGRNSDGLLIRKCQPAFCSRVDLRCHVHGRIAAKDDLIPRSQSAN